MIEYKKNTFIALQENTLRTIFNTQTSINYKAFYQDGSILEREFILEKNAICSFATAFKDVNNKSIHLYDILRIENKYFICIYDDQKEKVEFLYFSWEISDFVWYDECFVDKFFTIIGNGIKIALNKKKNTEIPKTIQKKIISIVNRTNLYYTEYGFKES